MEILISNITGSYRTEKLHGREHLVVPMTMIVPGVLNGSGGPLYYSIEEISHNHDSWNGMPIVVYHPRKDGKPVSARDPEILNKHGVGQVLRSNANGKLAAEAWIDVAQADAVDPRILSYIKNGVAMELSTGLFLDAEDAPEGSIYNGKPFTHIAKNFRPDHLALLPDQIGACSIKEGCGLNVNEDLPASEKSLISKLLTKLGILNEQHQETNDTSHDGIRDMLYSQLRSRFTQEDSSVYISDVFDGYIVYMQQGDLFKLGYSKVNDTVELSSAAPVKVVRDVNFKPVTNEEPHTMAKLTDNERKTHVDGLIANCECWKEQDRTLLNGMTDDKLKELTDSFETQTRRQAVANAAIKGVPDKDGNVHFWNDATGKWEVKEKETKSEPTANTAAPQTTDEWMKTAPAEVQEAVRNSMEIQQQEKDKLVADITANVAADKKAGYSDWLKAKSLNELKQMASLIPAPVSNDGRPATPNTPRSYVGAATGVPTDNQEKPAGGGGLRMPSLDFTKKPA